MKRILTTFKIVIFVVALIASLIFVLDLSEWNAQEAQISLKFLGIWSSAALLFIFVKVYEKSHHAADRKK